MSDDTSEVTKNSSVTKNTNEKGFSKEKEIKKEKTQISNEKSEKNQFLKRLISSKTENKASHKNDVGIVMSAAVIEISTQHAKQPISSSCPKN